MKCPECGLVNPETAQRCECGYAFAAGNDARLPSPFPPRRVAWWKRSLLLGVSISVGVVLVVLAILAIRAVSAGWRAFDNRSSPPRTWAKVDLKGLGIRLRLKTEWRDGGVAYQFNVEPRPADLAATLDEAWRSTSDIGFTILLADRSGFQMCWYNLGRDDLVPNIDDLGRVVSLSANGTFDCSRAKYTNSQSWTVRYVFPNLISLKNSPPPNAPLSDQDATVIERLKAKGIDPASGLVPNVKNPLWRQKARWRLLRKGMTHAQVRALLGDPGRVTNGIAGEYWLYPDYGGGEVDFEGGGVSGWDEP